MKKTYNAPEVEIVNFTLTADILLEASSAEQSFEDGAHTFVGGDVSNGFGW